MSLLPSFHKSIKHKKILFSPINSFKLPLVANAGYGLCVYCIYTVQADYLMKDGWELLSCAELLYSVR
jgi:hypothetical protein